ncbi:PD-(D/E)XK motif protein [Salinisphaera orenii]|uniref:PD-(D/E)XK motif protein n=1 Tax=Salinisphaera orenii TaxID=856731 RepID=UPI000DBE938B
MTEAIDPWRDLPLPPLSEVSGRRVDPDLPWGLFWGLDGKERCLFLLRHETANGYERRLPRFSGLSVEARAADSEEQSLLVLRLRENEHRQLFHRLCIDVIEAMRTARDEREAVALFVARTWRWHRFLRSGRSEKLSLEEQKGLIGELRFLSDCLVPLIGETDALMSWTGPFGAPKDFEIGTICVESKARRGASKPFVSISGEYQLDDAGMAELFLHVCDVTAATGIDGELGSTLTDWVNTVRDLVAAGDPSALELLDERLAAVGFNREHDYSADRWLAAADRFYEVRDEFPRITAGQLIRGVASVKYAIDLHACEPFRLERDQIKMRIRGSDGNER